MNSTPKKGTPKSGEVKLPAGKTDLKEQLKGMQNLLDSYPGGMFSVDRDYRYTAFNDKHKERMLTTYGISIEAGHNLLDCITVQKDREAAKQNLDRVLIGGETFTDRDLPINAAGSKVFFNINYMAVKDKNGSVVGVNILTEDITDRKAVEENLRTNEEFLRLVFETSEDAIVITAPSGVIIEANPTACRMSGMTREEMILAGRNKFFDTNDPSLVKILEEFSRTGKFSGVLTFIRKDGSKFPGEISSIRYKDKDGNILTSSFIRDITERKLAEEAKQEAEARYRGLFEQTHDAIFILDLQGRHLTENQRAADMMGYTPEEMHGLSVRETSAELQQSLQVIQQLLDGKHISLYERLFQKKDGTIFPVEINVELVRDMHGNPLHIQSVVRDISERKLAEKKISESEERFRLLFERSQAVMIIIEPTTGQILEANPAAENFYGYSMEELRSMSINQINTLPPETIAAERQLAVWKNEISSFFHTA